MVPIEKNSVKELKIGEKIKSLRNAASITVEDLARKVGITPAVVSQIEADVVPPTIATLLKISKALRVSLGHFFQDEIPEGRIGVVRKEERRKIQREPGVTGTPLSYSYEALTHLGRKNHMQPFLIEFDIDTHEALTPLSHEGEEFLFVLSGEVEFRAENQVIVLGEGDSIYFESRIPHILIGKGKERPRAVAVLYSGE